MRILLVVFVLEACGASFDARVDAGPNFDASVEVDAAESTDARPTETSALDGAQANDDAFLLPIRFDDVATRGLDPADMVASATPCRAPILVRVVRATDGDTITVAPLDASSTEIIRLIGVDTPEVAHTQAQVDECYGPEARAFTRQLVGHLVWLTFDNLCTDPYDRTLAYVHYAADPSGMWARQLIRRGLGRVLIIGRNRALERDAYSDQSLARTSGRGFWSACD